MQILEIKNLTRKDVPLFYRNVFSGSVVYNTITKKNIEKRIEFSLERDALGSVDIQVKLLEEIDYPLIPALKSLKNYISDLNVKGLLV